jgi:glycosyltransferase involved in cell wall biosynthesis
MTKRILIGSPVHQKPDILREFLTSLLELEQENLIVEYQFIDDNESEESSKLLADFANNVKTTVIDTYSGEKEAYHCDEYTHHWKETQIWKVAQMKDQIITYAKENDFDYLLLIDSDLILHPYTLKQLIKAKKEIISNIFWTKWQPDAAELPQVWLQDKYTLYHKQRNETLTDEEIEHRTQTFLEQLRQPGVYKVGGLGACTLITKHALARGVKFAEIPNISYWGEDRHFSIRATALGLSLYVDTHYPAYHLYRASDLTRLPAYKRKCRISMNQDDGITISLCMIVKNEEDVLERCLASIQKIVDEIIIVDTGSTDRTKEIAEKFSAKIFDFEWIDDFSAARNYAFNQATMEYILWLDADDFLQDPDQAALLALKKTLDPEVDSVSMHYNLAFDTNGKVTNSLRRNRLVRRACGFRWIGFVHEYLEVSGHIMHSEIAITHKKNKAYTDRNLQIYRQHQNRGEEFSVRDLYYFANELRDNALYEESKLYYEKFLSTRQGWIEDNIAACLKLADCYQHLCERDQEKQALLRTFHFDRPRAETCCRLGALFIEEDQLQQAVFWYELATRLEKPTQLMGALDHASWTWIPHLQLCLCYDRLGNRTKAVQHNDLAYSINPDHPSILHNKRYFDELLAKQNEKTS